MYDYREAVKDDVRNYIAENLTIEAYKGQRDELEEMLNNDLWADDGVTGNASGSYYCNSWKAEESLCHNLDLLAEALEEFGCDASYLLKEGAEAADVTIRCYLLSSAISEVLDEYEDELTEDEEDEEDEEA